MEILKETPEQDDEEINSHKSESHKRPIKQNDVFDVPLVERSHKKHCDWMRFDPDTYCPSHIKHFKNNRAYQKALDCLNNYITKSNISDLSRQCDELAR